MEGIVYTLYECEGESIIIRTLSVKFIVINFNKNNIISLHDLLVCQYTFSTCQQAFSFSHEIQYTYFPIYFLLGACAHDLRLAPAGNFDEHLDLCINLKLEVNILRNFLFNFTQQSNFEGKLQAIVKDSYLPVFILYHIWKVQNWRSAC